MICCQICVLVTRPQRQDVYRVTCHEHCCPGWPPLAPLPRPSTPKSQQMLPLQPPEQQQSLDAWVLTRSPPVWRISDRSDEGDGVSQGHRSPDPVWCVAPVTGCRRTGTLGIFRQPFFLLHLTGRWTGLLGDKGGGGRGGRRGHSEPGIYYLNLIGSRQHQ